MESALACALIIGCPNDEEPPPSLPLVEPPQIPHDYAPFMSEEEGRLNAELVALSNELDEAKAEIKRLKKEAEEAKEEPAPSPPTKEGAEVEESKPSEEVTTFMSVEATAYTAYCDGCSGITATGVDVRNSIYYEGKRVIAVDPSVIPLGSHVKVTLGDGSSFEAVAKDTGSDIKGNRIDILFETKEEALKFGRQTVKITKQ